MIAYVDNGDVLGWYYITDGECFGDGTKELAEELAKELGEN